MRKFYALALLASLSREAAADPSPPEEAGAATSTATVPDETATSISTAPLALAEVRQSIAAHHPLIAAARARVDKAEGAELSARGYFDPTLKAQGKVRTLGYYDLRVLDAELRQRTGLWGVEVFGGYRLGTRVDSSGPFPSYSPDQTLAGGEFRLGAEVPLFRDGPIDAGRARLQGAEIARDAAEIGFDRAQLDVLLSGIKAYFRWVAAGQKWRLAESTLRLAEERAQQMQERAGLGLTSDFDRLDNERMVFERRDRIIASQRDLEAASYELGLFLRTQDGKPSVPSAQRVPAFSSAPGPAPRVLDVAAVARRLGRCHPQLRQARAELKAQEIELDLARNQVAPDIRVAAQVSRDVGDPALNPTLAGTVFDALVKVSVPLLLSNERGQAQLKKASVDEKRAEIRFAEERLLTLVRDVESRLRASHERRVQTERLSETSRALSEGERERLTSGLSNLLFVNVRELAALDADSRLVDAQVLESEVLFELDVLDSLDCS